MLSRFTRLSVVPSFFRKQDNRQSSDAIDTVISEIKRLAQRPMSNAQGFLAAKHVLAAMSQHSGSLSVQRVCCHALSNLAMSAAVSLHIVAAHGFKLIKRCLKRFCGDAKLCWLASSALWNLSRAPANRRLIGLDGVRLMLRVLARHGDTEKVSNTAIGALSNLSLCDPFKRLIAEEAHIASILRVLAKQRASLCVMASGAGLVNNLAVSDECAAAMLRKGTLRMLLALLRRRTADRGADRDADRDADREEDEDAVLALLHRNACSALNNLLDADGFLEAFLESAGVETVAGFLGGGGASELCADLLSNCLLTVGWRPAHGACTSLHLAAMHGKLRIARRLVLAKGAALDVDAADAQGRTCLDYAVARSHIGVVRFLSKCGARQREASAAAETEEVREAMRGGARVLRRTRRAHLSAIEGARPKFASELCRVVLSYISNAEMLVATRQFECECGAEAEADV